MHKIFRPPAVPIYALVTNETRKFDENEYSCIIIINYYKTYKSYDRSGAIGSLVHVFTVENNLKYNTTRRILYRYSRTGR